MLKWLFNLTYIDNELGRVSEGTSYPQIAFANAIALIAIIAILYCPFPAPKAT
jgi:hypothetical protein